MDKAESNCKKFDAIVFHENGVFIEGVAALGDFWVSLGPMIGWARFSPVENCPKGRETYQLREVRPAHEPAPAKIVPALGVLWRRQAAIEAQQSISAYLQGVN